MALSVTIAFGKKSVHPGTLFGRDARIALDIIKHKGSVRDALFLSSEFAEDVKTPRGMERPTLPGFSRHARTGGNCVQDDQCYLGDNPETDCCSQRSYGDAIACTEVNYCGICTRLGERLAQVGQALYTNVTTEIQSHLTQGACTGLGVAGLCIPSIVGGPLVAACTILVPSICNKISELAQEYLDPEN